MKLTTSMQKVGVSKSIWKLCLLPVMLLLSGCSSTPDCVAPNQYKQLPPVPVELSTPMKPDLLQRMRQLLLVSPTMGTGSSTATTAVAGNS